MDWMYAYLTVAGVVTLAAIYVVGNRLLEDGEFRGSPGLFGIVLTSISLLAGIFWPVTLVAALLSLPMVRVRIHRDK